MHGEAAYDVINPNQAVVVSLLLQAKCAADVHDSNGHSPLHVVAQGFGDANIVHLLLSAGCSPDLLDAHGKTAYQLAGPNAQKAFTTQVTEEEPQ